MVLRGDEGKGKGDKGNEDSREGRRKPHPPQGTGKSGWDRHSGVKEKEKGDKNRPLPRKRPPGHKGPYPPPGEHTW